MNALGFVLAVLLGTPGPDSARVVGPVTISKNFFNPSRGQSLTISFDVSKPGRLSVVVLDRDGLLIRRLAESIDVQAGRQSFQWNGRAENGEFVPDEAYSLKIDLKGSDWSDSYFPANQSAENFTVKATYYDRAGGILAYDLKTASRIHIQAGIGTLDKSGQNANGPVLKTIVNREPRIAGPIIESWDGFDESNTIRIYDLPNFLVGIAATALPADSIITVGNTARPFVEWAAARSGTSLFTHKSDSHAHHAGLATLQDVAPRLRLTVPDGRLRASDQTWLVPADRPIQIALAVEGPSAATFSSGSLRHLVFVDQAVHLDATGPMRRAASIPTARITPGPHILAVNVATGNGPVAVDALRFELEARPRQAASNQKEEP
jgi:flagellar hook assembly protein FlgD